MTPEADNRKRGVLLDERRPNRECIPEQRHQRLQGSDRHADRQLLLQLRALRAVRGRMPVLDNETDDAKYTPIHKLEPLRRVWRQEYTLLGKLGKMLGLAQTGDGRRTVGMGAAGVRQLHAVRPLLAGLPGGQRHHLHDSQDARRHVGIGTCATRPDRCDNSCRDHRQPDGRQVAGGPGADPARRGRDRHFEVPVDREGAEYLVLLSSMESDQLSRVSFRAQPHLQARGRELDDVARRAFEATNSGIQIGASDMARETRSRASWLRPRRLKVKCGDQSGVRPRVHRVALGRAEPDGQTFRFEVQHVLEVLDELRKAGQAASTRGQTNRIR